VCKLSHSVCVCILFNQIIACDIYVASFLVLKISDYQIIKLFIQTNKLYVSILNCGFKNKIEMTYQKIPINLLYYRLAITSAPIYHS